MAAIAFLYLLLITPLQAGLLLQWEKGKLSATIGVMLWGVRKRFPFLAEKENGHWQLHFPFSRSFRRRKNRKDILLLLPRLIMLRKKVFRGIHLRRFQARALLSLPDAGNTAILCGVLNALLSPFPACRIIPGFSGQNRGQALCIVECRLGTLLLAGILWKLHTARHKKEAHTWNIPSEP